MITQEDVDVLRELEQEQRQVYHHIADALAAAIATIGRLPVTKEGVRVVPILDKVAHPAMERWVGDCQWYTANARRWMVIDEMDFEQCSYHKAIPVSECTPAAKGGGDA